MPLRKAPYREVTLSSRPPSLNAIWISDEVLSSAFNRFARFSNVHKRHGSNVPGPLEAQRRLARRRMVALASHGGGPSIDISTLFGGRGPNTSSLEWKAPGKGKAESRRVDKDTASTSWLDHLGSVFGAPSRQSSRKVSSDIVAGSQEQYNLDMGQKNVMEQLEQAQTLVQLRELAKYASVQDFDPGDFSKRAFERFLTQEPSLHEIFGFLNDPLLNHPDGHNLTRFLTHLSSLRRLSWKQNSPAILNQIRRTFELGLVSSEEMPKIADAISNHKYPDGTVNDQILKDLYKAVWRGVSACRVKAVPAELVSLLLTKVTGRVGYGSLITQLYKHLYPVALDTSDDGRWYAECAIQALCPEQPSTLDHDTLISILQIPSANKKMKSATLALVNDYQEGRFADRWSELVMGWLLCLQKANVALPWHHIYRTLAPTIDPLDLVTVFKQMPPAHVCRYLTSWFPLLPTYTCRHWIAVPNSDQETTRLSLAKETARTENIRDQTDWGMVQHDFEKIILVRKWSAPGEVYHFGDLLIALFRNGVLTMINQGLVLTLVLRLFGVKAVIRVCDDVRRAGVYLHPPLIAAMINRLVQDDPTAALALYKRRKVFTSSVPNLLTGLITAGVPSPEIFTILKFEDSWDTLPLGIRQLPENSLTSKKNQLVHAVAEAFSKQETATSRVAFRNVCTCYKYLKSRRAPINSVMSRALVHAGITVPLLRAEAVSVEQVRWVLSVVARVEGEHIAQELDELVWRWLIKVWAYIDEKRVAGYGTGKIKRSGSHVRPSERREGVPVKGPDYKAVDFLREKGAVPRELRVGKFMDRERKILEQRMKLNKSFFREVRRRPKNRAKTVSMHMTPSCAKP